MTGSRRKQMKRWTKRGRVDLNMAEASRIILALRAAGWAEKEINDFILYVETGDEKYMPKKKEK